MQTNNSKQKKIAKIHKSSAISKLLKLKMITIVVDNRK